MKRDTWKTIWQMGWKITLGCAVFALGFDLFLEPNDLNVGGMSGLAMVLRKLLGFGSIGVLTAMLNVPLFLLGAKKLGKKFLFGSLAGMLLSSLFIDLFAGILQFQRFDTRLGTGGIAFIASLPPAGKRNFHHYTDIEHSGKFIFKAVECIRVRYQIVCRQSDIGQHIR